MKRIILIAIFSFLSTAFFSTSVFGIWVYLTNNFRSIAADDISVQTPPELQTFEFEPVETSLVSEKTNNITAENQENLSYAILEQKLKGIIQEKNGRYAVAIEDLDSGQSLLIDAESIYGPASLVKVPFVMILLKDVEDGAVNLDLTIELKDKYKLYSTDYLYSQPEGTVYTTRRLVEMTLQYSDNTALNTLMQAYYAKTGVDKRWRDELGLEATSINQYTTNAIDQMKIYEMLYKHTFLNSENSEYILELLSHVPSNFNDRIVAGVPDGTRVAHKIGNWIGTYQDAGIVYGGNKDYIIVVLDADITYSDAKSTISDISRTVWGFYE